MNSNKTKSKTLAAGVRNQVNAYIKTLVDGSGNQILPRTWANAVMTESGVTAEAQLAEIARELGGISSTVAKARPNIIGTYPVAGGQTVTAGDVVDVQADGSVGKSVTPVANVETVYKNAAITGNGICMLTDTLGVACYSFSNSGQAVVINVVDGKVVPASDICTFQSGEVSNFSCARLSDTKFVVGYAVSNAPYFAVCEVSGTTITCGAVSRLIDKTSNCAVVPLSEELFLAVFNDSGLTAAAYSVSGITASMASSRVRLPGNTSAAYISATLLPDDSSGNKRVCVCFVDAGDGNKGKAVIATISSANVVTWGSVVTFFDGNTTSTSCCEDNGDVIVRWVNNVNSGVAVLSINEAAITPVGTTLVLLDRGTGDIFKVGTSIVYTTSNGNACVLEKNGTELSENTRYSYNDNARADYASAAAISATQFIVAYADVANSNYGTATILEVSGDQIAGGFTDESSQCIALQSGEAGWEVEVIFDGVAELPGAVAGREITSTGVYGYCPKDGWLWVRPEWDTDIVSGSFLNIENQAFAVDLGFKPKAVFAIDPNISNATMLMAFEGQDAARSGRSSSVTVSSGMMTFTDSGFSFEANKLLNRGNVYYYVAFR